MFGLFKIINQLMAMVFVLWEPKSIDYFTRKQRGNKTGTSVYIDPKMFLRLTSISNRYQIEKKKNSLNSNIGPKEEKP